MRAILIPENPGRPIEVIELKSTQLDMSLLRELQELLGGGLEVVRTEPLHALMHGHDNVRVSRYPTVAMVVDDEGIYNGKVNVRASLFYAGDILGNAILMAEVDDGDGAGDIGSLPDSITVDKVLDHIVMLWDAFSQTPHPARG
jgi:hypothetical protein